MLPERKWETEPLLRLVFGVCFCLSIGALLTSAVLPKEALATQEGQFFFFVSNSVVLHGGTLLLVSIFLREHGVGLREREGAATGGDDDWAGRRHGSFSHRWKQMKHSRGGRHGAVRRESSSDWPSSVFHLYPSVAKNRFTRSRTRK